MSTNLSDRRQWPRTPASGTVEILFEDPMPVTVEAELQETSERGFRIRHGSKELVPGLEVRLRRSGAVQRARVMWTHILDGRKESGCLLL
jgi:hypothetical protein